MKKKPSHPILLTLLILLIITVVCDALIERKSNIILQGFFTNDDNNYFPASQIQKEYKAQLNQKGKVVFEDGLYIVPGSSKDYTTASASKVVAYIAAHELDFLVTTQSLVEHYSTGVTFEDITTYLPNDSSNYELIYGKDGNGEQKALAVNLNSSRLLKDKPQTASYYLFIPSTSYRKENVKAFLSYLFT